MSSAAFRSTAPVVAVVLVALAPAVSAQSRATRGALTMRRETVVAARVHTASPIRIDGRLDEDEWRSVPATTHFVQREPTEGAPATVATDVRMMITDDAVIIGAHLQDDYRALLTALGPPTDGAAGGYLEDYFEVQIDPHPGHLTALALSVTPRGAKRSWLVGRDGTRDPSWNVQWEVGTYLDATGWTVEMRIPLSEFHVAPGTERWGVQFVRFSWRRQETDIFRALSTSTAVISAAASLQHP